MKLKTIVNAVESLNKLANIEMLAKDSFIVTKSLFAIEPHVNNFNTQRNNLLQKYGKSNNGIDYDFENKEKFDLYRNELKELEDIDIDIDIEKVKLNEDTLIAPKDLYNLLEFVEVM